MRLRRGDPKRDAAVALLGLCCVVVLIAIGVMACGSDKFTEPFRDAPRSNVTNSSPADVIEMPDGFSNAATKCDHGNRLYVGYHGDKAYGTIAVVANDPSCAGNR